MGVVGAATDAPPLHDKPASVSNKVSFEIIPQQCLGPFVLGMSIGAAVDILRAQNRIFTDLDLTFSDVDPASRNIEIVLNTFGMRLVFEPVTQRLDLIDIHQLVPAKVTLRYCGEAFCSPYTHASFESVYQAFGPWQPGTYNSATHIYKLSYPGITFDFPIDLESSDDASAPPTPTTPCNASRITLTSPTHSSSTTTTSSAAPTPNPCTGASLTTSELVHVDTLHAALYFQQRRTRLLCGDSPQDVLATLGLPSNVFYQTDSASHFAALNPQESDADLKPSPALSSADPPATDYFWNYYQLGIDILFNAHSHTISKFILHSNLPGSYDFCRYWRCNFRLYLHSRDQLNKQQQQQRHPKHAQGHHARAARDCSSRTSSASSEPSSDSECSVDQNDVALLDGFETPLPAHPGPLKLHFDGKSEEDICAENHRETDLFAIHPLSTYDDVVKRVGREDGQPLVCKRMTVGAAALAGVNWDTKMYGYGSNVVLAVVQRTGHIETVTVARPCKC